MNNRLLSILYFALALLGCTKGIEITSLSLFESSIALKKGSMTTLTAIISPENATRKTIIWSSSDDCVVSVDQSGKVTALNAGVATITAQVGSLSAHCDVTVTVDATSVTLNKTSLTLEKGMSETLVATVEPEDATDKTIWWSSSDNNVVSVDQRGKVTALNAGVATITAQVGSLSVHCDVTVTVDATSVSLNKTSLTLEKGMSETLVATVEPEDATDKTIRWSSSDNNVVSVDQSGKATALNAGVATIAAQVGSLSAHCDVTVTVDATSVTLNKTSLTLEKGKSEMLVATVEPEDATDKSILWSSSDDRIAIVDQEGKVSALKGGQVIIEANASGFVASCEVTVISYVQSISLNVSSLNLEEGDTYLLTATVEPEDATDKTITWHSDSPEIASVDLSGAVRAISHGKAIISATASGVTAICSITVKQKGIQENDPEGFTNKEEEW